MANRPLDQLAALVMGQTDAQTVRVIGGRPIAVGWATVELDRAAIELGQELAVAPDRFSGVAESTALGARCRVVEGVLPGGLALVLLEPATEGRLAASLARSGEGPAAIWLEVADLPLAIAALRVAGVEAAVGRGGPFGAERLVLDGPIHGPHRLLVDRAGTIRT